MERDMIYLKDKINKAVESIEQYDYGKIKKDNLNDIDRTIINLCDLFGMLTREQVIELRQPVLDALNNLDIDE